MNWLGCFSCKKKTLDDVKTLDFSRTCISEVPPEVFHFERTLENLHLDGNKITELPRTLFQCEELKYLDISDNEIQAIPVLISKLVNLHTLNLSRNCLKHTDIPSNVHRCQKLTLLDLSSNVLDKLPEGVTSLVNLQELYLNDTYIEFLPANFGRLNNLRILELRDNNLTTLPKSLRRLTALVRLDLSNNDFSDMPEVIGNMSNLKELWINGNCITSLIIGLGNLHELQDFDASKNDIEFIPKEIGRCTKLNSLILSHNLLKDIPHVIGNLKKLGTLKLDFNLLESLPYSIGDLIHLEELDIQNNRIQAIPISFGFLRHLNCLIASHNSLSSIPSEIGSCISLTILNLHNNMLKKLPNEIGHLQQLTSLGLIGNTLEYLPIPVANLPNLRALWLTQNQSHPLIPLQTEKLEPSGQLVLTCFLLPQIQVPYPFVSKSASEDMGLPKRHIAFTEPGHGPTEPLLRLTRAPTPYPKDFQRFQRSLNNHIRKNRDSIPAPEGDVPADIVMQGNRVNFNLDPETSQIKEAKVTTMKMENKSDDIYPKSYSATLEDQRDFQNTSSYSNKNIDYSSTDPKTIAESAEQSKVSLEIQQEPPLIVASTAKQPPPYYIAAAYSKNAKYFNNIDDINKEKATPFPLEYSKILQNLGTVEPVQHSSQNIAQLEELNLHLDMHQYGHANGSNRENLGQEARPVPKKLTVVLAPCCYVLGFTVIYNENGVFVNKVDEIGNAFQKLYPGDKILMLDKIDLTKMEPWQAYKTVLIQGPETESFYIMRY